MSGSARPRRTGRRPASALVSATVALLLSVAAPPALPAYADAVRDAQWHLVSLDLATAHQLSRGEGVTVAVIDTGIDANHPDLVGNVLPGVDLLDPSNPDGRTPERHGTSVAGVIAGHGHGPGGVDGVLGVAPAATILPIRISTDDEPVPASELIADAIEYAVEAGAKVINISLSSGPSQLDARAVAAARRNDVVVVAAAGNRPDAEHVAFPAAHPGAVAVGATDRSGQRADFSATGDALTLTAPGDEIITTGVGGTYVRASGTSYATPIVAGAAALVRARFPEMSADEVVHRLVSTAVDLGAPGHDEEYGYGVVDIVAALTAQVPPWDPDGEPDQVRQDQWHLEFLDVAAAHRITRGAGVTVAVVDTPIDPTHPDLHRNVLPAIDPRRPGEEIDAAAEAARGGNGTVLAGLVAGHGNRLADHEPGPRGVLGIAPEASLLPVRGWDQDAETSDNIDLGAEAIIEAARAGADVILYVAGTASMARYAEALEAVREADAVLVTAVGDRGTVDRIGYPAAAPSVVAVGGVDRDGLLASFSLTGPEVTLVAPAVDITSTARRHGYTTASSTSTAAAIVAGAAALVRAHHPELSAEEVVHRLVSTARDAGPPGRDDGYGAGVLDLVAALTADVPPLPREAPRSPLPELELTVVAATAAVATLLAVLTAVVVLTRQRRRPALAPTEPRPSWAGEPALVATGEPSAGAPPPGPPWQADGDTGQGTAFGVPPSSGAESLGTAAPPAPPRPRPHPRPDGQAPPGPAPGSTGGTDLPS